MAPSGSTACRPAPMRSWSMPGSNTRQRAKLLDINMMVGPGGKERTREEFRALLAKAGLRLTRIVPTLAGLGIVEAVAA